jgi:trans-AT polyketide synthase/acyltransferase/oxidoreductase domain-containing protein
VEACAGAGPEAVPRLTPTFYRLPWVSMNQSVHAPVGAWRDGQIAFEPPALSDACSRLREPLYVIADAHGRPGVGVGGRATMGHAEPGAWPLLASLAPLYPEWLGDRGFNEAHGTRFAYVGGAMANGITTTRMVIALAEAGMLAFFGAAGLGPDTVRAALTELRERLDPQGLPWGSNLIHSPNEPDLEQAIVDLYLEHGVRRVSASAYMNLTPMVVQYAYTGIRVDGDGRVVQRNHLFAKISRPEVAERFMRPAPAAIVDALVAAGRLTAEEGRLARLHPVAEDLTAESDSGGHTDNRPLGALLPTIAMLRDRVCAEQGYTRPIRVGAAGGIGTPQSAAAAYALGASYILVGSVHQGALESGLSDHGRALLANAGIADVTMAPAADMFELGVDVQVLQRGTMFANRARRLYDVYQSYPSLDALPADVRARLEREVFQRSIDEEWESTRSFFAHRNPAENERAARDPKHKMALVFRSYLGQSSRWAIRGVPERTMDYQIWCGPAMGSFNAWVKGSHLEPVENRSVVDIALNLLEGAATVTRAQQLRTFGCPMPPSAFHFAPRPLSAVRP